jgi:hypothetical protein
MSMSRSPHVSPRPARWPAAEVCLAAVVLGGCGSQEAPRLLLPVTIDASQAAAAVTSDLGYSVTLTRARAALEDLQFTTGGETHLALLERVERWLLPVAQAHPGHGAGGEVVGELRGWFLVDWLRNDAAMGTATLVASRYRGANFGFRTATASELPASDPLIGHTFHLEGTASRDGRTIGFTALLDVDETAVLIGAPFDHQIAEGSTEALGLRLLPTDPTDARDTLWNQVDFFALAGAASATVQIAAPQEAHNVLVRAFRAHDHYDITPHQGNRQ